MAGKSDVQLIDLGKFIASIGVLAIHECIFPDGSPANRLELCLYSIFVPFFFGVSSYLFFSKTRYLSFKEAFAYLLKFCKRLGVLYFVWLLVYLVFTPHREPDFFHAGFFKQLFFGHTFFGSWYLSALLVGTVVMFLISRVSYWAMLLLGCAVYCYMSCHRGGFLQIGWLYEWYAANVERPISSFPVGLPFIALGAAFVVTDKKEFVKYISVINGVVIGVLLSMVLVSDDYKEIVFWIIHFLGAELGLFLCCRCRSSWHFPSLTLRRMSVIIYLIHPYFIYFLPPSQYLWDLFSLKLPVVLFLSLVFAYGIVRLSERKRLSFLRYFY